MLHCFFILVQVDVQVGVGHDDAALVKDLLHIFVGCEVDGPVVGIVAPDTQGVSLKSEKAKNLDN